MALSFAFGIECLGMISDHVTASKVPNPYYHQCATRDVVVCLFPLCSHFDIREHGVIPTSLYIH